MTEPPEHGVASPCIGLCLIDEGLGHCLGCGRTRTEIGCWLACSEDEKLAVVRRAAARRAGAQPVDGDPPET